MLEKEKIKKLKKPLGEYFRLIIEAKKSGGIRRIFDAFNTIERIDHASRLLPSKFHIAASLYTAPTSLGTNLIGELIWGSIVLQKNIKDIENYLVFKRSLESLILESKWSEALSLITSFELQHGTASLIKELSIAITQQSEGTVKQVAFSRKIEAQCVKNAFPHFIRFASERNEDRLTLSGFRRNFRETYKSTADEPLVYAVIQWHALHQLPYKEELLSQLLSFEGSGSIFDYFETFIAIATEIATRFSHNYRTTLKNCLKRFSDIDDQRIVNLTRILEYQYTSSVSPLTATNVLSEIRARAGRNGVMSAIETTVFRLLEAPLPNGDDRRTIHKLSANFYHLDFFQALFYHLEHKASPACLEQAVAPGLSVLAKETSLSSVFACSFVVARGIFAKSSKQTGIFLDAQLQSNLLSAESTDALLFRAIALSKNGDIDSLIELTLSSVLNSIDRSHLLLITIAACCETGRFVDLLPFALELSSIRLDALLLVPIVKTLEKILPGRLSGRDAVLFSIIASRVLSIEESDRLEDKLMVAAEVALPDRKSTPKWIQDDKLSLQLWIDFLRDVLIVQNMLLIDEVNSLRDALDLRAEILRQLAELDPENRATYHEEVRDIAFDLSVDEGIRQVNTSRLNVNIQGLTKWANDHCIDDYERYKELVIGEATAGEVPIKLESSHGSILDQIATIPFGVADDQVLKLLARIRSAYLSDPRNGLDAYISLRVRHGSLAGTLSRGLDARQLLLLRKSENGPFEAPNYWIEKFGLSTIQLTAVTRAFATFTSTFRKSIDHLLQNRLRVKNERNPHGEITVEITDIFIKGLKIDIVSGLSFEAFISMVFLYYKNTVSTYLESLREYLKTDFLNNTINALETLSEDVAKTVHSGESISHLSDAITNARLELHASIKVVCEWLEIAQKEDLAQLYNLNQATKIGINFTKQVRNEFQPNIRIDEVDESFRFSGSSLIVIVDILFILLDNVFKHAGRPNERTISLNFDLTEVGLIKIRMRNDLDSDTDRRQVALRFEAARTLISSIEGEKKLTDEDRSGLPKLSGLVAHDRADALTFDLIEDVVEVRVLVSYSNLGLAV